MLPIGDVFDQFFNVDRRMHRVVVLLSDETTSVNEVICISNNTRYGDHYVVVDFVKFARLSEGHKKLTRFLFLCSKNHT